MFLNRLPLRLPTDVEPLRRGASLYRAQYLHKINARGTSRRNPTRDKRDPKENGASLSITEHIRRTDAVQERVKRSTPSDRYNSTNTNTDRHQSNSSPTNSRTTR